MLVRAAGRSRGWPVLAALAWLGVEFLAARVPFGGFGWLRLGYTQIDSPLAGLYPFIGVAGVSFSVVLTGQPGRLDPAGALKAAPGLVRGVAGRRHRRRHRRYRDPDPAP
ncbi:hypothetical protein [Propioniciclava flava]